MKLKLFTQLICFCIICTPNYAQERITHYSVNDGLSQHSVTSIIQDHNQMLWIGTFDGLNRFDGNNFTSYRHIANDENSLANNRILALHQTQDSEFWILYANHKIGRYDYASNKFYNFDIEGIKEGDFGNLAKSLISIDNHIVVRRRNDYPLFTPQNKDVVQTERIKSLKEIINRESQSKNHVKAITIDNNDRVWLSTIKGIGVCLEKNGKYDFYLKFKFFAKELDVTSENRLICYNKNIFIELDIVENEPNDVSVTLNTRRKVTGDIMSVKKSSNGDYFAATTMGLQIFSDSENVGNYFHSSPIRDVYEDGMGGIWCGASNGLYFINKHDLSVFTTRFNDTPFDLANHINTIYIDSKKDELWVSTSDNKIHIVARQFDATGDVTYKLIRSHQLNERVFSVSKLTADTLVICGSTSALVATYDSEYNLDFIHRIVLNPNQQSNIQSLIVGNKLWFGAINGLSCYTFDGQKMVENSISNISKQLPKEGIIMDMAYDESSECLWLSYRGLGVYRVDLKSNQVTNIADISSNCLSSKYVWSLFIDSKKQLWIGTDAGLDLLQFDSLKNEFYFKSLTQSDGLVNDKIECIEEAKDGTLWLGTSQGVVNYDFERSIIKTYNHLDGFQSNSFNCSSKWDDDRLAFGGVDGLSIFSPEDIRANSGERPKVIITELRVNDQHRHIDDIKSYTFRNYEHNIRVDFASFYSLNFSRIKYKYILEGLNNEWKELEFNHIEFNNLKAGKYTFKIKSITPNGSESYNTAILELHLLRPIYLSTTAVTLYILLCLALFILFMRNNLSKKILANKLAYEEDRRLNESRNIEEKLKFYTNMAHEIKTPLTLIQGPALDIAYSKEATAYILSRINLINNNINILKGLTDQILDFRSAIKGKLSVDLSEIDIMIGVLDIVNNCQDLAKQKGVVLTFKSEYKELFILFDEPKLVRILYNLLSNALKFTDRGDSINVSVNIEDNQLVIKVADTGRGIDNDDLPHIFERFYKSNSAGGSGIGLAFSKSLIELMGGKIAAESDGKGKGALFTIIFPSQDGQTIIKSTPCLVQLSERNNINRGSNRSLVLLVEDNIELNNYLKDILSKQFDVIQNYNGKEALETIKTNKIDLLITDIMIPYINGIKLCEKMRQFKHTANIPIILISAKTTIEDQISGLDVGAVDYITKPFNPQILVKKVNNILEQYYASRKGLGSDSISVMIDPNITVLNRDEIFAKKAKSLVCDHLSDEDFGVNQMSKELGVSRVHLTREFNRVFKTTPSMFIREMKLNHARYLLSVKKESIKAVLFEIGMKSHSGFTRIYKEKFGYLPSEESSKNEPMTSLTDGDNKSD